MTPQSIKEEVLKEFDERFREEYRKVYSGFLPDEIIDKGNPWFESLLSSAIDKAYAAGKEAERSEIGNAIKSLNKFVRFNKDHTKSDVITATEALMVYEDQKRSDYIRHLENGLEAARTNTLTDTI